MKRGKKKLTIVNIVKKMREKKAVAIATVLGALYILGDYVQDGMVDGSLVLSMVQMIR